MMDGKLPVSLAGSESESEDADYARVQTPRKILLYLPGRVHTVTNQYVAYRTYRYTHAYVTSTTMVIILRIS